MSLYHGDGGRNNDLSDRKYVYNTSSHKNGGGGGGQVNQKQ